VKFRSLKILDKFKPVFEKMGIDYKAMRKILEIKFILDRRRVPTINTNNAKEDDNNQFLKSLLSYALIGLVLLMFMVSPVPIFVKMTIVLAIIMFMIMTTMISDFSSVLLDVKDKKILLSRPIDEKTINTAKVIHIFIYLFIITMTISLPTLIVGSIKYSLLFFIIFFIDLILIDIFIIFLASLLYTIIIKYFDGEKLKDIINNFQILLSVTMAIGYQFVGRMFSVMNLDVTYSPKWWSILIPPAWFAAPFSLSLDKDFNIYFVLLSILAIVIPVGSLIVHIKLVGPYFEKNIAKLNKDGRKDTGFVNIKWKVKEITSQILTRNKEESIFIRFSQSMLSNERNLKLRIYPSLALAAIFPFIMMMNFYNRVDTVSEALTEISNSKSYLTMYFSVIMTSTIVMMIKTSDSYKGSWIYKTLPLDSPAPIFKGAIKGLISKYILPIFLVLDLIFLLIYGPEIIIDLLIITLNMILLGLVGFKFSSRALPFSKEFGHIKEDSMTIFLISFAFGGGAVGLHFLFKGISYGLYIYLALILIGIAYFWRSISKITWEDI